MLFEPSASVARAVMPTTAPVVASSSTALAAVLTSLMAETSNSSWSVTLIENVCVAVDPSDEVA